MNELEGNGMGHAQKVALTTLKRVPISQLFVNAMTRVLTDHGATLAETRDYPQFDPPYKEYTITFPAGTVQAFGMSLMHSSPFVILFPDGYELHGKELWTSERASGNRATIIFFLPEDLVT
jgi:hypothetical protein